MWPPSVGGPGRRVHVALMACLDATGDPSPGDPALMKRFVAAGPSGDSPVPGVPDTEPAGFEAFAVPGLYTIVYDSGRSPLELDAAKFEEYLRDEGLERISALRARQGKSAAGAKEVF